MQTCIQVCVAGFAQVRSATKLLKRVARAELGPRPPGGKRAKANPAAPGMSLEVREKVSV